VIRDLSHELDYLSWMMGRWLRVAALGGQFSKLEINSDDVFILLFETDRCPAITVHLNYLDRGPHRTLRVNTEEHTFGVDLIEESLCVDGNLVSSYNLERDATYRAEHEAIIDGNFAQLCTLEEGQEVINLIEAAEKSVWTEKWIER